MILLGQPDFPVPARVLFIQTRRIGDVLFATPALRTVAERFPTAKLDFVVERPCDEALWGNPHVDRLLLAPQTKSVRAFLRFIRLLREKRYDWVIDFFSNPRSAQIAFLSGACARVGLDRFGRRWAYTHRIIEEENDLNGYAVDWRLAVLERMGVPVQGRELEIYADTMEPQEVERVNVALAPIAGHKPIVAVATGTINPAKLYPPELVAEVISGLLRENFAVIVTAGPGERPLTEQALALVKQPIPVLYDARVPTLAALYRRVHLYLGPDSAPKHIAVACGLPTVTFFGPGRPSNWNDPQNPRNVVIAAPCDIRPNCTTEECVRRGCLKKIAPAELVRAVKTLL
jgi:ADP-heptose:LPS heptosyltransferase